jgi:hypothetical protein
MTTVFMRGGGGIVPTAVKFFCINHSFGIPEHASQMHITDVYSDIGLKMMKYTNNKIRLSRVEQKSVIIRKTSTV